MTKTKQRKGKVDIRSTVMYLLLLLSVFIFVWIYIAGEADDVGFNNEEVSVLPGEWQVSCGEETLSLELPSKIKAKAGDVVTLTRTLDEESCVGNAMMFYARQTWVQISIDGTIVEKSDEDRVVPFDMTPGSYWHLFRLPEEYAGKTVTIELKPALDKYAGELPAIYTGNKAAFVYMAVDNAKGSLLLMGAVLVIGMAMLACGIASAKSFMGRRLVRMGLFAMASSMWLLLESRITQVFVGNMVVASYLLFACYFLIPVLACSFLQTYETMENSRIMNFLFWISAVLAAGVHILQIAGLAYYIDMVPIMYVMLFLIIADSLFTCVRLRIKRAQIQDKSIYMAMILLGVCCLFDVLQYYIFPEAIIGNFSKVGILLFFGYLGYVAIRLFGRLEIQEAENRVYKKLAYSDMMTGIANRTAFEGVMSEYREAPWKEETILLVADVNRLKYINDNYGHAKGDAALVQIAELMKQQFKDGCLCFRTGGDEFCVISRGITEKKFAQMCHKFSAKVNEIEFAEDFRISVSCGYSAADETGIDECYKRADAIMYEAKAASKMQRH